MTAVTWEIGDGTTTIDLLGSTWKVLNQGSWAPAVAGRNPSNMGGLSPYSDVDENPLWLSISGTDKGDCLTTLQTLVELMDQAEIWSRGENVDPVYMEYQPSNSDNAPFDSRRIIKGPSSFGPMLTLPSTIVDDEIGGGKVLGTNEDPIILQYRASGLWFGFNTESEGASASSTNPEIITMTDFTTAKNILVPVYLNVELSRTSTNTLNGMRYTGFLVLSSGANGASDNNIQFLEAEDVAADTNFTSTAIAAASGGDVMRTDTGQTSFTLDFAALQLNTLNSDIRELMVFAMLRNNSSTITYDIYFEWIQTTTSISAQVSKTTTIDTSDNDPQLVHLGNMYVNRDPGEYDFTIDVTSSASVTAGNTLDIDYVCLVAVRDGVNVIEMIDWGDISSNITTLDFDIDHRLKKNISPLVQVSNSSITVYLFPGYGGNAVLTTRDIELSVLVMAHHPGDWVMEDDGGGKITYTASAVRENAHLIPQ